MRTALTAATVEVVAMKRPPSSVTEPLMTLLGMFLWVILALGALCFIFASAIMVAAKFDMVPQGVRGVHWMHKNIIGCMVAGAAASIAPIVIMGQTGVGL